MYPISVGAASSRPAKALPAFFRTGYLMLLCLFLSVQAVHVAWAASSDVFGEDMFDGAGVSTTARETVRVAVVSDGPGPFLSHYLKQVREELQLLLGADRKIVLVRTPELCADWKPDRAEKALKTAMSIPDVDVILSAGMLPTTWAARPELELTVPVVAGFHLADEVMHLPVGPDLRSAKKNLNFIYIKGHMRHDFRRFAELIGKGPLLSLTDKRILATMPGAVRRATKIASQEGMELRVQGTGAVADEVLASLPEDVRAIYLTPAFSMSDAEWQKLIDGLNARHIPTFSLLGEVDVRKGVLGGSLPDMGKRMARRVALHIQQILDGVAPENLPVSLPIHFKTYVNMDTARTIDFFPSYQVLMKAQTVGAPKNRVGGSLLTLDTAMHMAAKANADMTLSRLATREARQSREAAASPMLPQVRAEAAYGQIDQDRSTTTQGRTPWEQTTAGLRMEQMIFDDSIISRFRQARQFLESAELDEKARREDVMLEAGLNYLNLLVSRSMVRIEQENLRLTQDNLKLATVRRKVGVSGPEEVYRWEASLAEARSRYIKRLAEENSAQARLNRALGADQSSIWDAEPLGPRAAAGYFLQGRLVHSVRNARDLKRIRSFSRQVALERYSIQALEKRIKAQQIELARNERSFYLPKVGASLEYDHMIDARRSGTDDTVRPAYRAQEDTWAVGLKLTLPLFEGGGRIQSTKLAKTRLKTLEAQLDKLRQVTEEEVLLRINALHHSWPNIELTAKAAEASRKNLEVVQDKYTRGKASILDLLDAQNQAITQEQNAVIAIYTYVADMLRYQRAISWMEADRTPGERRAFVRAMDKALQAAPSPVGETSGQNSKAKDFKEAPHE